MDAKKKNAFPLGLTLLISALMLFHPIANANPDQTMTEQEIIDRISPVGSLYLNNGNIEVVVSNSNQPRTSASIYNTFCMACHISGAAGAPKVGDAAAWEPRIAKGREVLNTHAIAGFNAMPAKGGCMDCSDDEIIEAVSYILSL